MEVPTTKTLQIIMANKPRMLRDMLSKIFSRSEQVNVIGEVRTTKQLPLLVEILHPQWVVLTLRKNWAFPKMADILAQQDPTIGILAVAENGECVRARYGDLIFDGMALDELVTLIENRSFMPDNS